MIHVHREPETIERIAISRARLRHQAGGSTTSILLAFLEEMNDHWYGDMETEAGLQRLVEIVKEARS